MFQPTGTLDFHKITSYFIEFMILTLDKSQKRGAYYAHLIAGKTWGKIGF
jgi:hypothetical protein